MSRLQKRRDFRLVLRTMESMLREIALRLRQFDPQASERRTVTSVMPIEAVRILFFELFELDSDASNPLPGT